jgi:hypothetical protein
MLVTVCCLKIDELQFGNIFGATKVVTLCSVVLFYLLCLLNHITESIQLTGGPGSSVDITTDYGLDGPGIESRWGEIFRTCPDRSWVPPSLLYNG